MATQSQSTYKSTAKDWVANEQGLNKTRGDRHSYVSLTVVTFETLLLWAHPHCRPDVSHVCFACAFLHVPLSGTEFLVKVGLKYKCINL